MAAPNSQISLLVTSCNRHDLLNQTLTSFYNSVDIEPQEVVIYEDSDAPMPQWLNTGEWKGRNLRWISDGIRRGQAYACTRLIAEAKYPYVLWWEDDWLTQQGDFVRASKEILDKYPKVIQISLRGNTGWHPLADPDEIDDRAKFKLAMPYWHGVWGGWSWNPGMRRKSSLLDMRERVAQHIGVGGLEHEKTISKELLDEGWRIADLNREIVVHTGTQSRAAEPLTNKVPRILIAVPACFKFEYGKWESEDSPDYSQARAYNGQPYGKDIHISRPVNDRIDAVRATWAKDAEAFPTVDVKFFYGCPAGGYPRAPLEDEVFLQCPDDYEGLPRKTIAICGWANEHDYDYVLKCDDDTYVWVGRALTEIIQQRMLDYGGWLNGRTCAGGAGYWLSRRGIAEVVRNPIDNHWAEDVTVAKIMDAAGIQPVQLVNHRPGFSDHWFFPQEFDPKKFRGDEVSVHAVQPQMMLEIHRHARG